MHFEITGLQKVQECKKDAELLPPTRPSGCEEVGIDYLGNDNAALENVRGLDTLLSRWQDCGKLCEKTSKCDFWTFFTKGSSQDRRYYCYLKTSDKGRFENDSFDNIVSGAKNCTS